MIIMQLLIIFLAFPITIIHDCVAALHPVGLIEIQITLLQLDALAVHRIGYQGES